MKIYISTRALRPPFSGGATIYTIRLANELAALAPVVVGLTDYGASGVEGELAPGIERVRISGSNRSEVAAAEQAWILQARPDWCLYSYPGVLDSYNLSEGTRTAVIIYDLQHLAVPGNFTPMERWNRDRAIRLAVDEADLVFTISDFSAGELERFYPGSAAKTAVIYGGGECNFPTRETSPEAGRFLLYPANFWAHKNHGTLLDAFEILRRSDPDLRLVLTGGVASSAAPRLRSRLDGPGVEVLGYVSKERLSGLLQSASCLVFPSRYEGFGMPVLEALQAGTPVACSNGSSLPEVGGDAAEYFDPTNAEEMAAAIQRAAVKREDPEWPGKAAARAVLFTFQRSAALACAALSKLGSAPAQSGASCSSLACAVEGAGMDSRHLFGRFPSVDAIIDPAATNQWGTSDTGQWQVVDACLATRMPPSILDRLVLRSGYAAGVTYADTLRFVKNRMLLLVAGGVAPGSRRVNRLLAARIVLMQLSVLHRASREAVLAVITGRWPIGYH